MRDEKPELSALGKNCHKLKRVIDHKSKREYILQKRGFIASSVR